MSFTAALLTVLLLGAPPAPGRYAGEAAGGRVDLALLEDGRAIYGGAAMRWRAEGDAVVLKAPGGRETRLTLRHDDDGAFLEGGPFGPVRLIPLPTIEPVYDPAPVRPLAWVGAWRHSAPGGTLVLRLRGDGRYALAQPTAEGEPPIPEATGSWQATGQQLLLTPDGGAPLSYRARRDGDALVLGGGDLPVDVRFVSDAPR